MNKTQAHGKPASMPLVVTSVSTSTAKICVCCLSREGRFFSLVRCRHLWIFGTIQTFRMNPSYQICVLCHHQLVKCTQFRQQIYRNLQLLQNQVPCLQTHQRRGNLDYTDVRITVINPGQSIYENNEPLDYSSSKMTVPASEFETGEQFQNQMSLLPESKSILIKPALNSDSDSVIMSPKLKYDEKISVKKDDKSNTFKMDKEILKDAREATKQNNCGRRILILKRSKKTNSFHKQIFNVANLYKRDTNISVMIEPNTINSTNSMSIPETEFEIKFKEFHKMLEQNSSGLILEQNIGEITSQNQNGDISEETIDEITSQNENDDLFEENIHEITTQNENGDISEESIDEIETGNRNADISEEIVDEITTQNENDAIIEENIAENTTHNENGDISAEIIDEMKSQTVLRSIATEENDIDTKDSDVGTKPLDPLGILEEFKSEDVYYLENDTTWTANQVNIENAVDKRHLNVIKSKNRPIVHDNNDIEMPMCSYKNKKNYSNGGLTQIHVTSIKTEVADLGPDSEMDNVSMWNGYEEFNQNGTDLNLSLEEVEVELEVSFSVPESLFEKKFNEIVTTEWGRSRTEDIYHAFYDYDIGD